jgi:hypothetical protein
MIDWIAFVKRLKAECNNIEHPCTAFNFHSLASFGAQDKTVSPVRSLNSSEKGGETCSSQAPTADRPPLLFHRTCRVSGLYIRHIPRPGQYLLMHL